MVAKKNLAHGLLILPGLLLLAGCTPAGPRALLTGRDLLEAGDAAAAIEPLKRATSLMVSNAAAWNYLGLAAHRAGQPAESFAAYQQAIKLDPDFVEARFNLGCLLADQGRPGPARDAFATATVLRPQFTEAWLRRARCELALKEPVAAEMGLREALRQQPQNVEALNALGLALLQRNRPREAASQFTNAVGIQPDYGPALLNLAVVTHQQLNDRTAALGWYQRYLALSPRPPDWDAVNTLVRSLQPVPSPPPPVTAKSNEPPALAESKPTATATRTPTNAKPESINATVAPRPAPILPTTPPPTPPTEVVRLAPEPVIRTTPVDDSATAVSKPKPTPVTNELPASAQTATTNASPDKRSFLSRVNPANLFRRDSPTGTRPTPLPPGESASPVESMGSPPSEAATRRPGGFPLYAYLSPSRPATGNVRECERLFAQGRREQDAQKFNDSVQSYRAAVAADPANFDAQFALGYAAYQLRSYKLSTWAWEHALAIHPDSVDARYNFALALRALNHVPEAADELEKVLRADEKVSKAHLTLGNIYAEQLKDIPRARVHYRRVLDLEPSHPRGAEIRQWLVNNKP